ncbi:unnamed protein product [Bursaphelenchus xylophilus]|uniref:(pine wood nematode) hypothetical protein n=1 Tax=Bursaphelenchus xylophilus TaxID=6326 RepID=A0A811K7U7_BURXY|nr:unnamed protein product [Bursaphelenchus xylophilus]CAG9088564.1 unnamed protein product [Bursaphelenchus xylophilus]
MVKTGAPRPPTSSGGPSGKQWVLGKTKRADVYDEIIAPACLYARTLKFFSCSKPSELILRILPNLRRGDL